ncbi:MAG: hypothetical protein ABIT23_08410 [Nitrosospira sp.]
MMGIATRQLLISRFKKMHHATDINYPESGDWTRKNIRIVSETHPAVMVNTRILAMNMEPVEMGIAPADRGRSAIVLSPRTSRRRRTMGSISWSYT